MSRATGFVALFTGVGFGFGLSYSTMTRPEVILDFLRWRDLGLLLVLGGAVMVTAPAYQLLPRLLRKPVLSGTFTKHASSMSKHTVGGAALFGIGWGAGGVCPGPAIAGLGSGNWPLLISLVSMLLGAYVQGWVASRPRVPRRSAARDREPPFRTRV